MGGGVLRGDGLALEGNGLGFGGDLDFIKGAVSLGGGLTGGNGRILLGGEGGDLFEGGVYAVH